MLALDVAVEVVTEAEAKAERARADRQYVRDLLWIKDPDYAAALDTAVEELTCH